MYARTSKPQEGFTCKDILMQSVLKREIQPRNFSEERCIAVKFWERASYGASVIFCCVPTFKEI